MLVSDSTGLGLVSLKLIWNNNDYAYGEGINLSRGKAISTYLWEVIYALIVNVMYENMQNNLFRANSNISDYFPIQNRL